MPIKFTSNRTNIARLSFYSFNGIGACRVTVNDNQDNCSDDKEEVCSDYSPVCPSDVGLRTKTAVLMSKICLRR